MAAGGPRAARAARDLQARALPPPPLLGPRPPRGRAPHRHAPRASGADDAPEWLRELREHAAVDDEVAALLAGAGDDPAAVLAAMRASQDALAARLDGGRYAGVDAPPDVRFAEPLDPFDLWVWLELYAPPAPAELELLQEALSAWFLVGRLGGYDAGNLQALYAPSSALGELRYEAREPDALPAALHEASPLETRGEWARFRLDMGTADELALDVLLNMLAAFSREQLGLRSVVVGGAECPGRGDWPAPGRDDERPEVTMDPMRGPRGMGILFGNSDGEEEQEVA